jgi:hypothetical protein
MNAVFQFLAGQAGRVVRAVLGLILIVVGIAFVGGVVGWILAIVGLVPLAAGIFDWCLFAPLFGLPFAGPSLRQSLK